MTTKMQDPVCVPAGSGVSAQAPPSDDKQPDKKMRKQSARALAALARAYNARDPKGRFAELFTPKGEFIDADDNVFDSHEAIAGEFRRAV